MPNPWKNHSFVPGLIVANVSLEDRIYQDIVAFIPVNDLTGVIGKRVESNSSRDLLWLYTTALILVNDLICANTLIVANHLAT